MSPKQTPQNKGKASAAEKPTERKKVPMKVRVEILTESGYRCAVPTCRELLILDLHHLYQVSEGGKDDKENLIALCPTDHARFHRGDIPREAIFAYKSMLVAIGRAFDLDAIDKLLFLESLRKNFLTISGDGVLHFSRLIAGGLATVRSRGNNNDLLVTYSVELSPKGKMLISAWRTGDHVRLRQAVSGPIPGLDKNGNLPRP